MKKKYLVDSENVGDVWVPLLAASQPGDQVFVFYTQKSPHMNYENVRTLMEMSREAVFIKCFEGSNALDFQLVTELGYMLRDDMDCEYVIVTNDTGFDAVVRYWDAKGMKVSRLSGKECYRNLVARGGHRDFLKSGHEAAEAQDPLKEPGRQRGSVAAAAGQEKPAEAGCPAPHGIQESLKGQGDPEKSGEKTVPEGAEGSAAPGEEGAGNPKLPKVPGGTREAGKPNAQTPAGATGQESQSKSDASGEQPHSGETGASKEAGPAEATDIPKALDGAQGADASKAAGHSDGADALTEPGHADGADTAKASGHADGTDAAKASGRADGADAAKASGHADGADALTEPGHTDGADAAKASASTRSSKLSGRADGTKHAKPSGRAGKTGASKEAGIPETAASEGGAGTKEAAGHTDEPETRREMSRAGEADAPRALAGAQEADASAEAGHAEKPNAPKGLENRPDQPERPKDLGTAAYPDELKRLGGQGHLGKTDGKTHRPHPGDAAGADGKPRLEQPMKEKGQTHGTEGEGAAHTEEAGMPLEEYLAGVKEGLAAGLGALQEDGNLPGQGPQGIVTILLCCIRKENLADLHNALVMFFGEETGKAIYQEIKGNSDYSAKWAEVPESSQKEKFDAYCKMVFEHSELADSYPQDFSSFLFKANVKRKNLNSLRAALQGQYGKDKGMRYYSLFKSHIKIMNRM